MRHILLLALGLFGIATTSLTSQDKTMDNQEMVRTFLDGFNDSSKIQGSLDLLAEDYHFTNPMVELHSKAEFIILAQEIGKVLTGVEIIRLAENDNWVAAFYIFRSAIPGVESNIATEWFRIEGGLIVESRLVYDASKWQKIYQQIDK